jgi:hypothetical protein
MSGLDDAARAARTKTDQSVDPGDHALAHALRAAQRVEEDRLLADALHEEPDLTGIEPPPVGTIVIPKPPGAAE